MTHIYVSTKTLKIKNISYHHACIPYHASECSKNGPSTMRRDRGHMRSVFTLRSCTSCVSPSFFMGLAPGDWLLIIRLRRSMSWRRRMLSSSFLQYIDMVQYSEHHLPFIFRGWGKITIQSITKSILKLYFKILEAPF